MILWDQSQIPKTALWDQSQIPLLMSGTGPMDTFLILGPDNGGHYLVPGIKNVSLGPVPDVNN